MPPGEGRGQRCRGAKKMANHPFTPHGNRAIEPSDDFVTLFFSSSEDGWLCVNEKGPLRGLPHRHFQTSGTTQSVGGVRQHPTSLSFLHANRWLGSYPQRSLKCICS